MRTSLTAIASILSLGFAAYAMDAQLDPASAQEGGRLGPTRLGSSSNWS